MVRLHCVFTLPIEWNAVIDALIVERLYSHIIFKQTFSPEMFS